ncbi:molybdopterin molybdotransferase MoeA [Agromyces ramosus]|uniref:Molybdopterin molybdenumtransferase n=1 Tax=Agromyces ramosus TaxID=33879 RepID=A0ABU0R3H5_9MICO|nr:molybdopterin molybdotransferase MoeA [Agromyces ramosus]MDQ0892639.1 molybdopterin molybdotransferase [Agromyces ramosus]
MSDAAPSWRAARRLAWRVGGLAPTTARIVELADADGLMLARAVRALVDLPTADASAMDGWAVAGGGPWAIGATIRIGSAPGAPLRPGRARAITTGGAVPPGTTAIVRQEHATILDGPRGLLAMRDGRPVPERGADLRRRGEELGAGTLLAEAGRRVHPALIALAAAAGVDTVEVTAAADVDVVVTGDEVIDRGVPQPGRVRDAFGPALPSLLRRLGAGDVRARRGADEADRLAEAIATTSAQLIVTTGGTAAGRSDHVQRAVRSGGGELVVAGVAMRPGHPVLFGRTGAGVPILGLPGNPLAAFACLLSFAPPLLEGMAGVPMSEPAPSADAGVTRDARRTLLRPVRLVDGVPELTGRDGSAMLMGLAGSDGFVVVPPDGVPLLLPMPGADGAAQPVSLVASSLSA